MNRVILGLVFLACLTGAAHAAVSERPNLIVIMADDLGYADVGFNGCKDIPTPNIDRIAQGGVRCTSGYVSYSVCSPSRAGFITGRYGQRFGYERNAQYKTDDPNMGLPLDEVTIARSLGQVGYKSMVIGKWHLGAHPSLHPLNRGFDEFYGHLGGGHRYMPEDLTIKDSYKAKDEGESYITWILRDHEPVKPRKYLTDEFSDEAVSFVKRHKDENFFLFLSYNAPHNPLQATEKYLSRFDHIKDKRRKTYAAMVSAVDDGVGMLLDMLDELKLTEDTIIFFLSDNGGPEQKNASDNGVLRGGKSDAWEGGFRVPFAVQWPGKLPAGIDYDKPVSSLDIMATITELAGASVDPKRPLDGVNLVPYLTGKNTKTPHNAIYLRKFDQNRYAVRSGDDKLIIPFKGAKPQLYNLDTDISETNNIASQYPEKIQRLDALRLQWDAELVEPRFLGLIHLPSWQRKIKRNKQARTDWFNSMDKNADGRLTQTEWLKAGNRSANKQGKPYNESEKKNEFSDYDVNGDGVIVIDEFQASVK